MPQNEQLIQSVQRVFVALDKFLYDAAIKRDNFIQYERWQKMGYVHLSAKELSTITNLNLSFLSLPFSLPEIGYLTTLQSLVSAPATYGHRAGVYVDSVSELMWIVHRSTCGHLSRLTGT